MELGNMIFGHSRGECQVDRDRWTEFFHGLLEQMGVDIYGYSEDDCAGLLNVIVRPYYWGDCTCGAVDDEECRPECQLMLPNFEVPRLGFKMSWYKYAIRDAYSNMEMTEELASEIAKVALSGGEENE